MTKFCFKWHHFYNMHKSVRSKKLIIERISEIDYLCNDDWNTIIYDDLDSEIFSTFAAQVRHF